MTREDAINRVQGYLTDYLPVEDVDELEEIIKALKQESVLDKVRAEIENLEEGITSYHNDRPWIYKDEALQIIDKYKDRNGEGRREGRKMTIDEAIIRLKKHSELWTYSEYGM